MQVFVKNAVNEMKKTSDHLRTTTIQIHVSYGITHFSYSITWHHDMMFYILGDEEDRAAADDVGME